MALITQNDNFKYLTFSLVFLLLGVALAEQFFDARAQQFVQSATVVTLLVSVWGVDRRNRYFSRNLFLPLSILATSILSNLLGDFEHNYLHLFLLLLFFILTSITTARQVLFTGEIDGNKILGAICLYIMLGLIWAMVYTIIHLLTTDAFSGVNDLGDWYEVLPDFIYFSFVTLTTLGFGDISPLMPITRFLVYFEAIFGQFYLTILVASLVGAGMSNLQKEVKEPDD